MKKQIQILFSCLNPGFSKIILSKYGLPFILLFALTAATEVFAANRYPVANGNWSSTSTWSATSGGASGASVPGSGDDVFVTSSTSFTLTMDADASCNSIGSATRVNNTTSLTISGSHKLSTGTINPDAANGISFTIYISTGATLACTSILCGHGSGTGSFVFNISGTLQNSGTTATSTGTLTLTCNSGSTVEYNGADQTVYTTTYENLKLSGSGTKTAASSFTVNGILNLSIANPSSSVGLLVMGANTLTMGSAATTIGLGDVTGIVKRSTLVAGTSYTFGNTYTILNFRNMGTLPTDISVKITLAAPSWKSGTVNRKYDIIRTGASSGSYVTVGLHYLDAELNGSTENKLVFWDYHNNTSAVEEHGRSNYNSTDNWVEMSTFTSNYFSTSFGDIEWALANTELISSTWDGSESTDWSVANNWTPSGVPNSSTEIIIPDASTTPNDPSLNPLVAVGKVVIENAGILNGVASAILTISGSSDAWSNIGGTFNASTSTVTFTNAAATYSGSTNFYNITIDPGAWLRMGTGSTMGISGTITNNGTWGASALGNVTVNYNGGSQTVLNANGATPGYDHLVLSGSGTKTMPGTTLSVLGNFTISGTAVVTALEAINTGGNFTLDAGTTYTMGSFTHTVGGDYSISGTLTTTGSTINFNGSSAQTINSGGVSFNNFTITNTGSTCTASSNGITVSGTFTSNASTILDMGTFPLSVVTVAHSGTIKTQNTNTPLTTGKTWGGTVNYDGASQTVSAGTYNNLTLSGSGGKTFPSGTTNINAILSIENGANVNTFTGNIAYGGSATLQYNSSSNRTTSTEWITPFAATGGIVIAGTGIITLDAAKTFNSSVPLTISTDATLDALAYSNVPGATSTWTINGKFRTSNTAGFSGTAGAAISSTNAPTITLGTGSTIEYTSASAQAVTPRTDYANIIISGAGTKSVAAGANQIIFSGTLTTGDKFTLKSDATGTASIGILTSGNVSGNLTVERYLPATARRFRFLASPVVGATSVNWRDNGGNTAGIGIQITGTGGATNNFDESTTNNPSAFSYNEENAGSNTTVGSGATNDPGWTAFTDGNTTALNNGKGFRVLVRGDRTGTLTGSPPAPTVTTISVTGTYPGNSVGINTTKTASNTNSGFNLVGNPYPSAIDWNAITKGANISSTYTVYSPATGAYVSWNGSTGDATQYIASGQGFFVQQTGAAGGLTINESHKTTGAGGALFKGNLGNHLRVALKYDDSNIDQLFIHFRPDATEGFDNFDGPKLANASVNIASLANDGRRYNINCLPLLTSDREVPISVLGSVVADYSIIINDVSTFTGYDVYLVDNFKNVKVKVYNGYSYVVQITSDSASVKDGRFIVVFKKSVSGNQQLSFDTHNFILFPNPATNSISLSLNTTWEDVYSFVIYNQFGQQMNKGSLDFNKQHLYNINIEDLNPAVYFVKVFNGVSSQTIRFVK